MRIDASGGGMPEPYVLKLDIALDGVPYTYDKVHEEFQDKTKIPVGFLNDHEEMTRMLAGIGTCRMFPLKLCTYSRFSYYMEGPILFPAIQLHDTTYKNEFRCQLVYMYTKATAPVTTRIRITLSSNPMAFRGMEVVDESGYGTCYGLLNNAWSYQFEYI